MQRCMVRLKSDMNINEILHQMNQVHHLLPPGFSFEAPVRQQTDNSLQYVKTFKYLVGNQLEFASCQDQHLHFIIDQSNNLQNQTNKQAKCPRSKCPQKDSNTSKV